MTYSIRHLEIGIIHWKSQVHKINRILDLAGVKTGDAILEICSGGGL